MTRRKTTVKSTDHSVRRLRSSPLALLLAAVLFPPLCSAATSQTAAQAVNAFGLDLLSRIGGPDTNAAIAPYSIEVTLAMTWEGAMGDTRQQIGQVLHFTDGQSEASFSLLRQDMAAMEVASGKAVRPRNQSGRRTGTIVMKEANRLFGERSFAFRKEYLSRVEAIYGAELEPIDFARDSERAARRINRWVSEQTQDRIGELISKESLTPDTRLVLVNAIYLKAAWEHEFNEHLTRPQRFLVKGREARDVLTMEQQRPLGYRRIEGFQALALPYVGGSLQFLILLPDDADGLERLENKITPELLAGFAKLPAREVRLWLPKFKLAGPVIPLGDDLRTMGMRKAFDEPKGSADFSGIAPRTPHSYLAISEVLHRVFFEVDEHGAEAAAATAVLQLEGAGLPAEKPKAVEVHVDRPFLFAIQHRESGVCVFLGRVVDPR